MSLAAPVWGQHAGHDHTQGAPAAVQPLSLLADALADGSAALAADDFARFQDVQVAIRSAFRQVADKEPELAKVVAADTADPLPSRPTIAAARKDFARFSTGVADTVRSRNLLSASKLRIFECTMVPQVGTARWLQRESGARNPFFGAAMLKCGTEVGTAAPTARALPPGHPPIGHLTATQRERYKTSASESTCGSCGMSQAAMAAGEPCETSSTK